MEKKLEEKITSFLEALGKNEELKRLFAGYGGIESYKDEVTKSVENYIEREYEFNENENYSSDYTDFQSLNREMGRLKADITEDIDLYISKEGADHNFYNVTKLLQHVIKLEKLERTKQQYDKVIEQVNRVKNLFGKINTKKNVVTKSVVKTVPLSSNELTSERNFRLSVLNELFANGEIEEKEFINDVVAVRKCYQRELEKCVVREAKELQEEQREAKRPCKKIKTKVKGCVNKIKRIFKIGEPESDLQEELAQDSASRIVLGAGASQALLKVVNLLDKEGFKGEEKSACRQEAISIYGTIPYFNVSGLLEAEFKDMLKDNPSITASAMIQQPIIIREFDGSIEVKTKERVNDDMVKFMNFMKKKYKSTLGEYGQPIYEEAMEMFKRLGEQVVLCGNVQTGVVNKASKIADKIKITDKGLEA